MLSLNEWLSPKSLAVKGADENFRIAMVECYRRLAENMPDNGLQLVMFTHQDVDVWADLSLILWSAGLRVTAAWTIATETDTSFRTGKYVQGTVLLVLRKRKETLRGDRSDIYPDVHRPRSSGSSGRYWRSTTRMIRISATRTTSWRPTRRP